MPSNVEIGIQGAYPPEQTRTFTNERAQIIYDFAPRFEIPLTREFREGDLYPVGEDFELEVPNGFTALTLEYRDGSKADLFWHSVEIVATERARQADEIANKAVEKAAAGLIAGIGFSALALVSEYDFHNRYATILSGIAGAANFVDMVLNVRKVKKEARKARSLTPEEHFSTDVENAPTSA